MPWIIELKSEKNSTKLEMQGESNRIKYTTNKYKLHSKILQSNT